ncbi:MAG TPA: alpha/beta hydrolase [Balneolaceae bacterium]
MSDCRFFTYHGWGFDSDFWNPWNEFLSSYGPVESYDRGYFNNPRKVELQEHPESVIIVTHSFGLHFVEEKLLGEADLLIITGGFLHFHPDAPQKRKRSRLILQQMIKELEANPEKVLHQFYKNCFSPGNGAIEDLGGFNHQLLLDDLRLLHQSELDIKRLKKADKVCILHGVNDQIVSNQKGRQLDANLGEKSQYFEMKNSGHALPYINHRQCLEFIEPHIEQV